MKLFKSKEEKEILFKQKMRGLEMEIGRFIKNLEKSKDSLLEEAINSRREELDTQFNNSVEALKMNHARLVMAKSMLSDLRITLQIRDMQAMTGKFFEGMGKVSQEINRLASSTNTAKIELEFGKAIANAAQRSDALADFLNNFGDMFQNAQGDSSGIGNEVILKMIDSKISMGESEQNKQIAALKNGINKGLKG
jgi:hypothetical protein